MGEPRALRHELVQRTGASDEDLREWEGLGLIASDVDGRFRVEVAERVRLLRFAISRGVSAQDVARLCEERGDIVGRFVELRAGPSRSGPRRPGLSLEEAATQLGQDPALVRRFWMAAGLGDQAEVFDEDLGPMQWATAALNVGLPEEAFLQIIRVHADALARVAEAESRLFHIYVHERLRAQGVTGAELDRASRAQGVPLMELIIPAIVYFHQKGWERAIREDFLLHLVEDLTPPGTEGRLPVTVLFVDLAGFTTMTEAMGDEAAAGVLSRFSELVRDAAASGDGRLIKQIGDAFMLVFPSAQAVIRCGLAIAERVAAEPQFPAVHMGAHTGTALYREGDYLGTDVNIAARVAGEAGRGQFVVTESVRDAAAEEVLDVEWTPIGRRHLKGVFEPQELFEVHRVGRLPGKPVDPVCDMEVDRGRCETRLTWRGRELFFCSEACFERFVVDPERYESPASAEVHTTPPPGQPWEHGTL